MTQEWLNRIALTIALRNQPKRARTLLDTYDSAPTAIQQHPEFGTLQDRSRDELGVLLDSRSGTIVGIQ